MFVKRMSLYKHLFYKSRQCGQVVKSTVINDERDRHGRSQNLIHVIALCT